MRSGHEEVIFYSIFILFIVFLGSMGFNQVVFGGDSGATELKDPPEFGEGTCEISGWDAVVDAVKCAVDNASYYFSIVTTGSNYKWLNYIILIPISIGLVYVIIKELIRGS